MRKTWLKYGFCLALGGALAVLLGLGGLLAGGAAPALAAGGLGLALSGLGLLGVGLGGVFADLARRRRLEADLQRALAALQTSENRLRAEREESLALAADIQRKNDLLSRAEALKSEFLANMSHELKTPLNAILGFSEMLRDGLSGEVNAEQQAQLGLIAQAASRLLALVSDLLDLSRIEAGKFAFTPEDCDPARLLEQAVAAEEAAARGKGITLGCDLATEMGRLHTDPRRLRQIVANLLSNALKFTPVGGRVEVRARRLARAALAQPPQPQQQPQQQQEEAAEYLELSVSDNGPGIAPALRKTLFQPFVSLDASLTRAHGGCGLGLALAHRLAALLGGELSVESVERVERVGNAENAAPGGACFRLVLPWRAGAPPAARQENALPEALCAIVVEDDDMAAELISSQLGGEGIAVLRARSAEEALKLAAHRAPDLFTVDILLPGMDGWELLARLKDDPRLAGIPVVVISIVADSGKGLSLGAAGVLQKPCSRRELGKALHALDFSRSDGSPPLVLVVDDDPHAVELFASHLAHWHYRVLRAGGGAEGLALARAERPDLIVLDLMMPEMSGFEVVEHLKADAATAAIPVLIVTAKTVTAEDREQLNGNVLHIMEKSEFNHGRFVNEVRRALRRPARAGKPPA